MKKKGNDEFLSFPLEEIVSLKKEVLMFLLEEIVSLKVKRDKLKK